MRIGLCVISVLSLGLVNGQNTVGQMTESFYATLNEGDSSKMSQCLSLDLIVERRQADTSFLFDYGEFMTICSKFESKKFREEFSIVNECIGFGDIHYVEVAYKFYLNGTLDHCGTDVLIWKSNGIHEARIYRIYSTEIACSELERLRKQNKEANIKELDLLVDNWHLSATKANFEDYFGFMSEDFYFLGTAPGEHWSKTEFSDFSRPYFDKGRAWAFIASNRNWYFNAGCTVAWFDEDLNTWMEGCRGSGVLRRGGDDKWKLDYYNLTVLIENEKIKEFIELRKK